MSNQFLKLRRSAVPGRVPSTSSIDFGEIALNTYDGLAFIKRSGSLGEEVITLGSREGAFTGSFSGSFVGNGGGLFNIPASGIVGLNLSQIATGSVTASVSTGAGSFSLVSGSSTFLYVSSSGNVGIGTSTPNGTLTITNSEVVATAASSYGLNINANQVGSPGVGGAIKYGILITPSGAFNKNVGTEVYGLRVQAYSGTVYNSYYASAKFDNRVLIGNGTTDISQDAGGSSLLNIQNQADYSTYNGNPNTIRLHLNSNTAGLTAGIYASTNFVNVQSGIFFTRGANTGAGVIDFVNADTNVQGTLKARIYGTGNLRIQDGGTFTDTGERLQVSGSSRFAGNMVITGSLTTTADAIINTVRIGTGPGVGNVYIGQSVGGISTTSASLMDDNVFIGRLAGYTFSNNSNGNVAIGALSLRGGSAAEYNTAVGYGALQNYTSQYTTALGYNAGGNLTTGGSNTIVGYNTGLGITTGASNTIIGAQITGLATTLSNTVIISDGAGAIRFYSPSTGNVIIGSTSDSGEKLQVSGSSRFAGNMVVTGSTTITNGDLSVFKSSQPTINFQDQTGFNNGYQNASFGIWSSSSKNFLINVWGKTAISANSHNFNNTGLSTVTLNSTGLNGFVDTNGGHSLVIPFSSTTQRALTIVRTENTTNTAGYDAIRLSSATYGTYTFFRVDDIGNIYSRGNGIFGSETSFGSERLQVSGSARITDGLSVTGSITANNITVTGTLTAQTIVAQTITSSTDYVSGSTIFGNSLSNTHQFTGSVSITGSLSVNGGVVPSGNAAVNQITYWTGANTQTGSADLTWDGTNVVLGNDKGLILQTAGTNRNISIRAGVIADNFANVIFYPSSGINVGSTFTVSPRGTGYSSQIKSQINVFNTDLVADNINYEFAAIRAGGTSFTLATGKSGTGTNRPILLSSGFLDGVTNPNQLWLYTTGNIGIATTSDTGDRLQVSGSSRFAGNMVISGSGNTSATNALAVLNSGPTNLFRVRNDGYIFFGTQDLYLFPTADGSNISTSGRGLVIATNATSQTGAGALKVLGNYTSALGSDYGVWISHAFSNGSGGIATHTGLLLNQTINQTGGASGITRGLYVNPTITAAADFRAIEWSNNAATSPSASWGLYGAGTAPNYLAGNLQLNQTATTYSERLQVNGTSRLFSTVMFGTNTQGTILGPYINTPSSFDSTGINLLLYNYSTSANSSGYYLFNGENASYTSGDASSLVVRKGYSPSSGNGTYTALRITPTISQMGGASGITRGLYVTPSLVNPSDYRAVEWSNNAVSAPSASWGLYGAGTAPNYLNGILGINTTSLAYGSAGNSAGKLTINNSSGNNGLVIRNGDGGYQVNIKTTTNDSIGTEFVWYDGGTATFLQYAGGIGARLGLSTTAQFRATNSDSSATIHTGGSATERFRVTSTGDIGIGTTTPTAKLDIRGNTFVSGTLDILDAEINYQRNNNVTTGSARLIASIPTASLNAAFFDYVIVSGSNARAGTVTSVWVSSSVEWNETYTNDIGSTSDVTLYSAITGSSIGLFATSSINNVWTIKSLIRTI